MQDKKQKKYEALAFDLGNTIFYIDFDLTFQYWEEVSGVPFSEIKHRFVFNEQHRLFEKGFLSERDYCQHVSEMLGFELSYKDFFIGWNRIYKENFTNIDTVLQELRKDYRLIAVSNTNITHEKVWKYKYSELMHHFEMVFASHHFGLIKPEPAFYEMITSYLNVPAESIIFLDDKAENIQGAVEAGMDGIVAVDAPQMYGQLGGLLQKDLLHLMGDASSMS